jgi:hypothetical protein
MAHIGSAIKSSLGMMDEDRDRWSNKEAYDYMIKMEEVYGRPSYVIHGTIACFDFPIGKIIYTKIKDEQIFHAFPMPHTDFLYSTMEIEKWQTDTGKHKVPPELIKKFASVTGSIIIDPLKGQVTARCGKLIKNAVTLGFVEDGIKKPSIITPAQYAKRIKNNITPPWYVDMMGEATK